MDCRHQFEYRKKSLVYRIHNFMRKKTKQKPTMTIITGKYCEYFITSDEINEQMFYILIGIFWRSLVYVHNENHIVLVIANFPESKRCQDVFKLPYIKTTPVDGIPLNLLAHLSLRMCLRDTFASRIYCRPTRMGIPFANSPCKSESSHELEDFSDVDRFYCC